MDPSGTPRTGAPFAVTVEERHPALVVQAAGELDRSTTPRLRAIMQGVLRGPRRLVVLDLTGITFFGVSGTHLLLDVLHLAGNAVTVRIVAHARATLTPLRVTEVLDSLDLYPTLDRALHPS